MYCVLYPRFHLPRTSCSMSMYCSPPERFVKTCRRFTALNWVTYGFGGANVREAVMSMKFALAQEILRSPIFGDCPCDSSYTASWRTEVDSLKLAVNQIWQVRFILENLEFPDRYPIFGSTDCGDRQKIEYVVQIVPKT